MRYGGRADTKCMRSVSVLKWKHIPCTDSRRRPVQKLVDISTRGHVLGTAGRIPKNASTQKEGAWEWSGHKGARETCLYGPDPI